MARAQRPPLSQRMPDSPLDPVHPAPVGAEPGNLRHFMSAPPPLNAYTPTPDAVPYPTVLVTGPQGAGKSTAIAHLSADTRVGETFVVEWGFSSSLSGELAAYPGARYQVIRHDGTWNSIMGQIRAVSAHAATSRAQGAKPTVLAIDTMTGQWKQLTAWAGVRARSSAQATAMRNYDPNAPVDVGFELWGEMRELHEQLMDEIVNFPGIVVLTAQAQLVQAQDPRTGKPTGRMVHRVFAEKSLADDVSAVVRLNAPRSPWVIGKCNSLAARLEPEQTVPGMTLAALIFDKMAVGPTSGPRTPGRPRPLGNLSTPPWVSALGPFDPASASTHRWERELACAEEDHNLYVIRKLWGEAVRYRSQDADLLQAITAAGERVAHLTGATA